MIRLAAQNAAAPAPHFAPRCAIGAEVPIGTDGRVSDGAGRGTSGQLDRCPSSPAVTYVGAPEACRPHARYVMGPTGWMKTPTDQSPLGPLTCSGGRLMRSTRAMTVSANSTVAVATVTACRGPPSSLHLFLTKSPFYARPSARASQRPATGDAYARCGSARPSRSGRAGGRRLPRSASCARGKAPAGDHQGRAGRPGWCPGGPPATSRRPPGSVSTGAAASARGPVSSAGPGRSIADRAVGRPDRLRLVEPVEPWN